MIRICYDRLLTGLHIGGAALIFVLMMIIVLDVLGRTILNHPLTGTPELVKVTIVTVLFLGMAKTLRSGKHIRATVLIDRVSSKIKIGLNLLANIGGLILFALIVWSSWYLLLEAWQINEFEGAGALRIPTTPIRALILFCSFLTALQFIINIANNIKQLKD